MPTKENALVLRAVDPGGKNTEEAPRLESQLPPQQVQRSAQGWRASWGGEVGCDSQQGKESDSGDSRKTFIILMF